MKQYPNIDAIIEDSDTKVQDLAKVIGVSTKQIRRWRDGTSEMGIEKLEKLCRYYHVSADYILGLPRDLGGRTKPVSLMRHNSFTPLMKGRMPGHGATCMSTPIGGSCCLSPRAVSSYARKRETSSGRGTAPHGSRRASSMSGICPKPHGTARFSSTLPCSRIPPVSGSATVWKCPRCCGSFFLRWTTSSRTSRHSSCWGRSTRQGTGRCCR